MRDCVTGASTSRSGRTSLRIRERHLPEKLAWLSCFTLSLLKQHPGRQSLVMKRRSCG